MVEMRRILIIGGGGVGTMAAYALEAQTGGQAEVTMVLRSNFNAVLENGFTIDSVDHGNGIRGWRPTKLRNTVPNIHEESDLTPYDFVVVCTKNIPDVGPTVAELIKDSVTPKTTAVVLMQNGLHIENPLFPDNPILSGIQLIGATERSHGVISHDEPDKSLIGAFENPGRTDPAFTDRAVTAAKDFVRLYSACGKVDCTFDDRPLYNRWRKLVYNASYNSVSAILRMNVSEMRLLQHPIDDLVKPIMAEILSIAAAVGVHLDESIIMHFITVDSLDSWFMPSMGQDALKGNYLEFENIVGEPVREAEKAGVPCPTLKVVYGLLKGIQAKIKVAKGLVKLNVNMTTPYR